MASAGSAPLNPNEDQLAVLVHVTAPATLPEGYTFEAEVNGNPKKVFTCIVPEGGVEEGQKFLAPLPSSYNEPRLKIPTGKWKDGLCDWYKEGICHPSLCCSFWCTQIAMGQTIQRLNLTWLGEPGSWLQARRAFSVIILLVYSYIVYSSAMSVATAPYEPMEAPTWIAVLRFVGNFLFCLWAIYSLCRTRETLRARYQIPEERCDGCEDLCCSIWCSCCVTAQMLRHTGEYETHPGVCCSKTGHANGVPTVV